MVLRGDDGELRAFYNVCRHRGSRLREEANGSDKGTIMCPYHAWCYDLKGDLVVTPKVGADEIDRSKLSLWPVHLDVWQGFVFVNLIKGSPRPLRETIGGAYDDMLGFERFEMDQLRIGASSEWIVEANWKILIENYNECLHCPTVHPELVDVIPAYRKGWVFEEGRDDGGVTLASGGTYAPGVDTLPLLADDERGRCQLGVRRHDLPEHHDRHIGYRDHRDAAVPAGTGAHTSGGVVPLPPRHDQCPRTSTPAGSCSSVSWSEVRTTPSANVSSWV